MWRIDAWRRRQWDRFVHWLHPHHEIHRSFIPEVWSADTLEAINTIEVLSKLVDTEEYNVGSTIMIRRLGVRDNHYDRLLKRLLPERRRYP